MPRFLAAALAACICAPASSQALTVAFAGTVAMVSDDFGFLDASVAPGAQVRGTYEVDPSTVIGSSPFELGPAHLAFRLGGYRFNAIQDPHTIALINDRVVNPSPLITLDLWQSGAIADADLGPATSPSGDFGGYAAQIEFFDFESSTFNGGETEPFVPADLIGWDEVRLTLNSIDGSASIDGRVQVQVSIADWTLVPEPRTALLFAFGLALIAVRERSRAPAAR